MAKVLVTGGTGVLGTALAARLVSRGHEVTALARHGPSRRDPRVQYVGGDVVTGEGLDQAAEGADVVVHAATSVSRRMLETEVVGTTQVLGAARRAAAHLVYVSIVGVDRNPFGYYRAKLAAERMVEAAAGAWSIQRATQFHELVDAFLGLPLFPVTRHLAFQPVDVGDVSDRLVTLVESGPRGRAEDFGGPEVVALRELAAVRRHVTGRRARLVPVPAGGFLRAFDEGAHLCPEHRNGTRTWERWLEDRAGSDNRLQGTYRLRGAPGRRRGLPRRGEKH